MSEVNKTIAEQAAEWILSLEDGDATTQARTRREFLAWQQADPSHAQAAQTAQAFIGKFTALKASRIPARNALEAGLQHNKRKRLSAALPALVLIPLLLLLLPFSQFTADLHTSAGERTSYTLADGSRVTLAGKSQVDIHFDETRRELHLRTGEIYIDVARDTQRPFVVTSKFGQIEALGTQFIVNQHPQQTRLTMIESKVRVTANDKSSTVVQSGEQLILSARGAGSIERFNPAVREQAWNKQQLVVRALPLADVLRELAPYHRGYVYFNEATLPEIKVSAVLPLDKPEEALQLLANFFPGIRIRTITPWVMLVDYQNQSATPHQ